VTGRADAQGELDLPPIEVHEHGYTVRLPVYDGPLDLLLQLIRKEKLDIFDIRISTLTSAYVRELERMRAHDIEPASEFLVMAARLMQLKSRMLLPRPPVDDEDEADPRMDLVQRLLEYKRFQEVAGELAARPMLGREVFQRSEGLDRPPDEADEEAELARLDAWRLAEAFRRVVSGKRFQAPHDIYVERITIGERIAQLAEVLDRTPKITFEALCQGVKHREVLITTFLAVLEMCRLKLVRTVQGERVGPLHIEATVGSIGEKGEQAAGMLAE
jgi:segregation and condensation protein A